MWESWALSMIQDHSLCVSGLFVDAPRAPGLIRSKLNNPSHPVTPGLNKKLLLIWRILTSPELHLTFTWRSPGINLEQPITNPIPGSSHDVSSHDVLDNIYKIRSNCLKCEAWGGSFVFLWWKLRGGVLWREADKWAVRWDQFSSDH